MTACAPRRSFQRAIADDGTRECAVEWASGAVPGSTPGRFPDAPHRTRRAPFVTHRALRRRCHEGRGLLPGQAEAADARGRLRHQPGVAVAPTNHPPSRLAPAIALVDLPHAG